MADRSETGTSFFALLGQKRFGWLFACQFAGAANDNLFKNAMAILLIYRIGQAGGLSPQIMVSLSAGVFILPFFLFSASAGLLADRWNKRRLIRLVKFAELPATAFATLALSQESAWLLMAALFLLGVQAAFFGPLKYSVLPELLAPHELVAGNALVEGGTFLAILLGTIAGGLLILGPGGELVVSALMAVLALLGFGTSLCLPETPPGKADLPLSAGLFGETRAVLAEIRARPGLFRAAIGISWFWFLGAIYLAQFPALAKTVLYADETVVTVMLAMFSVGIGAGSALCNRVLKGRLSLAPVPWGALGIAVFAIDLAIGASAVGQAGTLAGLGAFLSSWAGLRTLGDLALIAVSGGLFIVPLYTALQTRAESHARARAVAANNILNAAFMVASALAGAALLVAGLSIVQILAAAGAATLGVGLILMRLEARGTSASWTEPG